MHPDDLAYVMTGLGTMLLIVTTATVDTSLFPEKSGYWRRFSFIGLRFGLPGFLIWAVVVFVSV